MHCSPSTESVIDRDELGSLQAVNARLAPLLRTDGMEGHLPPGDESAISHRRAATRPGCQCTAAFTAAATSRSS
jgi:hypothetical protein